MTQALKNPVISGLLRACHSGSSPVAPWGIDYFEAKDRLAAQGCVIDTANRITNEMSMFGYPIKNAKLEYVYQGSDMCYGTVYINFEGVETRKAIDKFTVFNEVLVKYQAIIDGSIEKFGEPDLILLNRHASASTLECRATDTTDVHTLFR